jgi:hypothetical protein
LGNVPPYGGSYGSAESAAAGADDGWGPATSVRASGAAPSGRAAPARGSTATAAPLPQELDPRPRVSERGMSSWAALLVLIVVAGIGGVIDMITGTSLRGGFNIGIIVASVVAILLVRRSGMFPIVIAPPIVYSVASGAMLYLRSNGLSDHKALYDAAANWLVYGFPAIAGATAAVLIIAGVRMLARR